MPRHMGISLNENLVYLPEAVHLKHAFIFLCIIGTNLESQ